MKIEDALIYGVLGKTIKRSAWSKDTLCNARSLTKEDIEAGDWETITAGLGWDIAWKGFKLNKTIRKDGIEWRFSFDEGVFYQVKCPFKNISTIPVSWLLAEDFELLDG